MRGIQVGSTLRLFALANEQQRQKTYLSTCAPSEDSEYSLGAFLIGKDASFFMRTRKTLIKLHRSQHIWVFVEHISSLK